MTFKIIIFLSFCSYITAGKIDIENRNIFTDVLHAAEQPLLNFALKWQNVSIDPAKVTFYYLSKNYKEQLYVNKKGKSGTNDINYNIKANTTFIIHGWQNSRKSDINRLISQAYLKSKNNWNIFIVDWSSFAKEYYEYAMRCIPGVAKIITDFIKILVNNYKFQMKNIFITGHSLGAHIAGHVGRSFNNTKLPIIIGLDPANPLVPDTFRLNKNDANYVQVIHSSPLGIFNPIGHADFYPNGGKEQPMCDVNLDDFSHLKVKEEIFTLFLNESTACPHMMSYEFFAESITNNQFLAVSCNLNDHLLRDDSFECDENKLVHMGGEKIDTNVRGIFYFKTANEGPKYALGVDGVSDLNFDFI